VRRVRPILCAIAIFLAACAGRHAASAAASPPPLRPCQTLGLQLDGASVVLTTNADGSLAGVSVSGGDPEAQARALAEVREHYGPAQPDRRVVTHQSKWGFPILTDDCGRPAKAASP